MYRSLFWNVKERNLKKSAFFSMDFAGIPLSWLAFVKSKRNISFNICSLSECKTEKENPFVYFLYFTMVFITGLSMFYVTAPKMKFSIKDFFSKCDQIRSFLRIWLHLLKKSLMGNFIFCAVCNRAVVTI